MANKIFKDAAMKVDSAAGSLTDITAYLTSVGLPGIQDLIEDSGMSDEEKSYLVGQAGATITLAGMVNTTTDGIFGPLVGNRTSVTKTVEYRPYTARYYNGEVIFTSVEYSGSVNSLQTFSAEGTFDGAINRTSAGL